MSKLGQSCSTCCSIAEVCLPQTSVCLLRFVRRLVDAVVSQVPTADNEPVPALAALREKTPQQTGVDYDSLGGVKRGRPKYQMDKDGKKESDSVGCRKNAQLLPSHTGGVFSFFCKHQICLGCAREVLLQRLARCLLSQISRDSHL